MTKTWPVRDAKAHFGELLDAALAEGPQVVTEHGVETAVVLPIAQWRSVEQATRPNLKELLLAPEPRVERLAPPRRWRSRRPPPILD